MSPEEKKVQNIIRLKRYEVPPEGYFDDFLAEFQKRRDGEVRSQVPSVGFFGRLTAWFRGVGAGRLVFAGGVAYAALIVAVLMWPQGPESRLDYREPIMFQPKPDPSKPSPKPEGNDPAEKF